jgi:hypothetical protein
MQTKSAVIVEVFKTNVQEPSQANKLIVLLREHFSDHKINFDLEDRDKILRIESSNAQPAEIIKLVNNVGFICEELQD